MQWVFNHVHLGYSKYLKRVGGYIAKCVLSMLVPRSIQTNLTLRSHRRHSCRRLHHPPISLAYPLPLLLYPLAAAAHHPSPPRAVAWPPCRRRP